MTNSISEIPDYPPKTVVSFYPEGHSQETAVCNLEVLGLNKEVKFSVHITPKTGIWSLVINVII